MNNFELYQENPSLFLLVLLVSFVVTIFVYGAFPLIFAKTAKKAITRKKYKRLCYGLNIIGMAFFVFINGAASGGPYLLWTWIFSNNGVKTLISRGLLKDNEQPNSLTNEEIENVSREVAEESNENFQKNSELDIEKPSPQESTESFVVDQIENKKVKAKYCSKCGSQIDPLTRKCTDCGKQYFKGLKFGKLAIIILLSLLLATSIVINVVQYNELNNLNSKNFSLRNNYSILEDENQTKQTLIDLYEEHIVFVMDDSKVYHRSGCTYLKDKKLNVAWKSGIEKHGYIACSDCYKKALEEILTDSKNYELIIGIDYGKYKGTFHERDCSLVKHLLDQWLPNQETNKFTEISYNKKGEFDMQKAVNLGYEKSNLCNCIK